MSQQPVTQEYYAKKAQKYKYLYKNLKTRNLEVEYRRKQQGGSLPNKHDPRM